MSAQSKAGHCRLAGLLASSSVAALLIGGGTPAFAACTAVTGPYTNSGAVSCVTVNNATFTGSVNNTGTISPGPTGIAVTNNSTIHGQITDSGTISVSGAGILVDSSSTINSGPFLTGAIQISGRTFVGGISNAGTIVGGVFGIYVTSYATFTGNIVNSAGGTITHGQSNTAINVNSFGGTFTGSISNAGTLNGSMYAGGATFIGNITNASNGTINGSMGASFSTFTGNISNAGSISGGIILNSVSTFAGGISNASGGKIQFIHLSLVAQFGTTAGGGITNAGTISAGGTSISGTAISLSTVTKFSGGITNSGTISAAADGIDVFYVFAGGGTLNGGISNSGTISAGHYGISISGISQFGTSSAGGGITNAGTISVGAGTGTRAGIYLGAVSLTGNISNAGTITAPTGIKIANTTTISGQIVDTGNIVATNQGILIDSSSKVSAAASTAIRITGPTFTGGLSNAGTLSGHTGIVVIAVSTFTGGITNAGTISSTGAGINLGSTTFSGGISNSGTITAGFVAIGVAGSIFSGGISNSGTLSGQTAGIAVIVSTFSGGISNSGTISATRYGVVLSSVSTFTGGITNSGSITAHQTGILLANVGQFGSSASGGISNSGTISATTGINVNSSGAVSIFDSGTIVGTGGTAIDLSSNAAGNTLTLASGYGITGLVKGQGADTLQLTGPGSASFNLSNIGTQYTGFGTFNVLGGVWTVSGATATAWTVAGGTFGGAATIGAVNVHGGATFAPGAAGAVMTVNGSLTLQSAAVYMVTLTGANPSAGAVVSGAATIGSGVNFVLAGGSTPVAGTTYTVLATGSGVTGTFANQTVTISSIEKGTLSYVGNDVDLTVKYTLLTPILPANAPANVLHVANAIDAGLQSGVTPPAGFTNLFNLSPAQLQYGLSQLSGEAATSAGKSATQLMTDFMELMLDPTAGGGGNVSGGGASNFAPEQETSLPSDVAMAYAKALKAPQPNSPQNFDQRWSAWGSAFGGASHIDGNAAAGTNNVTASDYGFAAGMDYHVTPDTVYGFGLAGGGTNWNLAQGLGSGRSDSFQAGVYAKTHWGPLYLSGGLAFANHWFTTTRTAPFGDELQARFTGQSYAARGEVGYRYAAPIPGVIVGVTPYAALQAQDFHTPSYSETDLSGGGFALAYNAQNATDTRSELGARFDNLQVVKINGMDMPLVLRGRLAWAHDWVTGTTLGAAFQALPGSAFTVNGAAQPQNSALTTAAAELHLNANWTAIAKFDGEFASGAQTYGGTGTLKYSW